MVDAPTELFSNKGYKFVAKSDYTQLTCNLQFILLRRRRSIDNTSFIRGQVY